MASGYALPLTGGSRHGYSHSYSGIHLSPGKSASNAFPNRNGSYVKKTFSNGSLYTHAETSRETSPVSPYHEQQKSYNNFATFEQNVAAFQENNRSHQHTQSLSRFPMKSRARGESDLGRPADLTNHTYKPTLESIPPAPTSWFSLSEALTSLLVPLPYVLTSASYSSLSGSTAQAFPPLSVYTQSPEEAALLHTIVTDATTTSLFSGVIETCILTSSTLLLVGILAKMQSAERMLDRRKGSSAGSLHMSSCLTPSSLQSIVTRALSLGLPFYASMQVGGTRTGLILLVAVAADLTCPDRIVKPSFDRLKDVWSSKVATSAAFVLSFITDEIGLTIQRPLTNVILGYLALATSVLVLQPPFPTISGSAMSRADSKAPSPVSGSTPWSRHRADGFRVSATSPLICSVGDTNITLVAGILLAFITILSSTLLPSPPSISVSGIIITTLTVAFAACTLLFSRPSSLRSQSKAGLAFGCLIAASCSFLFSPSLWPGTVCNGGLSALSFLGVLYDTNGPTAHKHSHDDHDHAHSAQTHSHHPHAEGGTSAFTKFIMSKCEPGSLLFSILSEKDSRRIAYFTTYV